MVFKFGCVNWGELFIAGVMPVLMGGIIWWVIQGFKHKNMDKKLILLVK